MCLPETSGPELPPGHLKPGSLQRNIINRYFFPGWPEMETINIPKTWGDGPYGENGVLGELMENRIC